ncbi:MAG: Holliday junction branch migration DNA helicase RuvB [Planctomycetota bacterium]|nr:Holliday junction branch migration DNA helicase RuvB [Planctomycetota bacterium]
MTDAIPPVSAPLGPAAAASLPEEHAVEQRLRPERFEEFAGQPQVTANLELAIRAAQGRGECLDHLLLSGLPGLGKTTLAHLVANETGAQLHEASAPTLQRAADLAGILTRLERGDVLFIDEIHRLAPAVEEYLYAAMEDFVLDILIDQGPGARSVRIDLPRFTLVGATTREGLLSAPLRSRFGIHERLEPYPADVLQGIVARSAGILRVAIDDDAAAYLAARSRGTPRVANRFLRRVRDLAQVTSDNHISVDIAREGLTRIGVDESGLTRVDRQILESIGRTGGHPLGLKSLAAAIGEDERTLEDVYEPHLLREGLIVKTPKGRQLTPGGRALLGLEASVDALGEPELPFEER